MVEVSLEITYAGEVAAFFEVGEFSETAPRGVVVDGGVGGEGGGGGVIKV